MAYPWTLKVQIDGVTGAPGLDYVQFESPFPKTPVMITSLVRPYHNNLYFGTDATNRDLLSTQANTAIKAMIAEFKQDGLPNPVRYVDADNALAKDVRYFGENIDYTNGTDGDGLHWNDAGNEVVFGEVLKEIGNWYNEGMNLTKVGARF